MQEIRKFLFFPIVHQNTVTRTEATVRDGEGNIPPSPNKDDLRGLLTTTSLLEVASTEAYGVADPKLNPVMGAFIAIFERGTHTGGEEGWRQREKNIVL